MGKWVGGGDDDLKKKNFFACHNANFSWMCWSEYADVRKWKGDRQLKKTEQNQANN